MQNPLSFPSNKKVTKQLDLKNQNPNVSHFDIFYDDTPSVQRQLLQQRRDLYLSTKWSPDHVGCKERRVPGSHIKLCTRGSLIETNVVENNTNFSALQVYYTDMLVSVFATSVSCLTSSHVSNILTYNIDPMSVFIFDKKFVQCLYNYI